MSSSGDVSRYCAECERLATQIESLRAQLATFVVSDNTHRMDGTGFWEWQGWR